MIVEPENTKTFRYQKGIAPCVTLHVLRLKMLPAIEFDDEICSVTDKIHHVRTNRRLPPKTRAIHPMGAKLVPDRSLSVG
jgi:hypothetical protein